MILLGQYIGGRNYDNATQTVASTVALFLAISLVMTIMIPLGSKGLATLMNAPQEALAQTISYIRICGLGIIAIIFFNVIGGLFRGIGDSKSPFILMMISCGINIIGDIFLVGVLTWQHPVLLLQRYLRLSLQQSICFSTKKDTRR